MTRRLFNLLPALSLRGCVVVVVLWVRSHRSTEAFEWWSAGAGAGLEFRVRGVYTPAGSLGFYVGDYPPGTSSGTFELMYHRYRTSPPSPPAGGTLGFAMVWPAPAPGDVVWRELRVPYWFLLLICAVAPVRRAAKAISGTRLRRLGLCPRCGYDLRATPGRCPECGAGRKEVEL